jgi:hypothetical protein
MVIALSAKIGVSLGFWVPFAAFIYLVSFLAALLMAAVNFVFFVFPRDPSAA